MRRLVALAVSVLALSLSGVVAPAQAVTAATPTRWQLQHFDDIPATAISTVPYRLGGFYTYWLANGFLYRNYISSIGWTGPVAYMGEAIQLPGVTSDLETKTNAAGDIAVTYTCADGETPALCVYMSFASGGFFSEKSLITDVEEFETAWLGENFTILAATKTGQLNPFDAPRTKLQSVTITQDKTVSRDTLGQAFIDPTVTQFNASKLSISHSAAGSVFAWESYESSNGNLGYVVRATVLKNPAPLNGNKTKLVAQLGNERVRSIGTSWLEGADGLLPTIMWVTDSQVLTAAETATNVWTAGASEALAGQALLADVDVTNESALYAVIKTRHITTPVISSFTLTDTRLPLVVTTVMANASSVTDLTAYQMTGSNPGVITCASSGTTLRNIATGATIRAWTGVASCGFIEMFDHAGKWLMFGIGTDYSATQNSPHALQWIDSAAPIDLKPSDGRIVDQDMVAVGGQRAVAYVVRDWVDPLSPTITRDRLLVQSPQVGSNGLVTLSNPLKRISNLHLVEMANNKAVAVWQESESTLFATSASSVKASVFDPSTREWSVPVTAVVAGRPIISLGTVAEGGAGQGQVGSSLLMTAALACSNCMSVLPTLLSFDPVTLTFTANSASVSEGAPALAAAQLFNGDSAWIFATATHDFEPWVYVRTSAGTWLPPVQLAATSLSNVGMPQIVPLKTNSNTGVQAAVVYNESALNSVRGTLKMQRLSVTDAASSLGAAVTLGADSSVDGNAVFDASGTLHFLMKSGSTANGFEHRFVKLTSADVQTASESLATVDEVGASGTVDALGRPSFVFNDGGSTRTYQPANSWATRNFNLGESSHLQSLKVVADTDGVTLNALWFHEINFVNALWTQSLSQIVQGEPGVPELTNARYTSAGSVELSFNLRDDDSFTRLEYRSTPNAQSFAGGVDADGTFSISGLELAQPVSVDVRAVENYGSAYEYAGAWTTIPVAALTVAKPQPAAKAWKSLSTAMLSWDSLSMTDEPYVYELSVSQSGVTKTVSTSKLSLDVTGLDAKKSLTYKVRGSLYGVWGPWTNELTLAAAQGPSAPRSLVVKKSGTKIAVQWLDPSTFGDFPWLKYRVEMRIGTGPWKVMASALKTKSWTYAKPLKGKKYSFRVTLLALINSPASSAKTLTWKG